MDHGFSSLLCKWDLPVRQSDVKHLVSSVHASTFIGGELQLQRLDRLLDSGFFTNCAWLHFHKDSNQSHLGLIVALLNRDFERSHLLQLAYNLWDVVLDNLQKWCALRDRISHLVTSLKAGSLKLASEILRLLAHIVRHVGDDILRVLPLWGNDDVILCTLNTYLASCVLLSKCGDLALYHISLSSLLVSCTTNGVVASEVKSVVLRTNFIAFTQCHLSIFGDAQQAIKLANDTLRRASAKSDPLIRFTRIQEFLYSLPDTDSKSRFVLIPSVYDCSENDIMEMLRPLSLADIRQVYTVATDVSFPIEPVDGVENRKVLEQAIIDAISVKPDVGRTKALSKFDETIIDASAGLLVAARSDNISGTSLPIFKSLEASHTFKWAWHNLIARARIEMSNHVILVLVRVQSQNFPQVKGRSKYWYPITSVEKKTYGQYVISTAKAFDQACQFVALIELVKPTEFSPHKRVRSYGLASMRIGRVINKNGIRMQIPCEPHMTMFEDRIKYLVGFPDTVALASLLAYMCLTKEPYVPGIVGTTKRKLDEADDRHTKRGKSGVSISEEHSTLHALEEAQNRSIAVPKNHDGTNLNTETDDVVTSHSLMSSENTLNLFSDSLIRILDSPLSAVPCTRANDVKGIIQSLLQSVEKRWLVVLPSQMFLNSVPDTRSIEHFEYIRYGEAGEIGRISALLKKCLLTISNLFEESKSFDRNLLDYYAGMVKTKWHEHTLQYTSADPEYCSQYPFSKSVGSSSDVQNHYGQIQAAVKFLKEFGSVSRFGTKCWEALARGRTVICTFHQYLNISQTLCNTFDRVCIVGCNPEALSLIVSRHKSSQLALIGGESASLFPKTCFLPHLPAREQFYKMSPDSPPKLFNPGFKFTSQHIFASDQVEEAEYCIALYQYMRLLGYPQANIGIWASTAQQGALMAEIVQKRCAGSSFLYGEPEIYIDGPEHVLDSCEYSIVSTFGAIGTCLYGRLGNYWVGAGTRDRLLLLAGENYFTSDRSDLEVYNMDGKEHLEQYVESMKKMQNTARKS